MVANTTESSSAMDPWVWAILLLATGIGLAVLEIFFPSAGILGFLSAAAILASIILGFKHSTTVGFLILAVAVGGVPTTIILGLKWWPHTAMGRAVMLISPKSEDVLPNDPKTVFLRSMVGQVAETRCKMLPGGAILLDGKTVDAVSEGMPIEKGQLVRVIEVKGGRVVVRPVEGETSRQSPQDTLENPADTVVPDPFDQQDDQPRA
jgi:membrane-bound ClpP family serine protease